VAYVMLAISGISCLFSPLLFLSSGWVFLSFLLVWGFAVVGDSPQFSTLVARTAPREYVGSALTIVNCIGFSVTIASIELLNVLAIRWENQFLYLALLIGPLFGLWAISKLVRLQPG